MTTAPPADAAAAPAGIVIRGTADAVDIAAVLAVLAARRPAEPAVSNYEKWRAGRLAALRCSASRRDPRP